MWTLILGMALVTYLLGYLPLVLWRRVEISPWLRSWLEMAPAAILAAMLAPTVFVAEGRLNLSLHNPNLLAALPTALVAWRTRNIVLTILVGMAASGLIQQMTI